MLKNEKHFNTYSYCKAVTETLVDQEREHVPACVVRPSIIMAALEEPFPGWVGNKAACTAVFGATGTASIRYVANRVCYPDMIPSDLVVNGIILAAWKNATRENKRDTLVYNLVLGDRKRMLLGDWLRLMVDVSTRYPLPGIPYLPKITMVENYGDDPTWWPKRALLYQHYVHRPLCYTIDTVRKLFGQDSRLLYTYKVYAGMTYVVHMYGMVDWNFKTNRLKELYNSLDKDDQQNFKCLVPTDMNYELYATNYWLAMRKYLFRKPVVEQSANPVLTSNN
jgi:fatty acyl-CoA reductase